MLRLHVATGGSLLHVLLDAQTLMQELLLLTRSLTMHHTAMRTVCWYLLV